MINYEFPPLGGGAGNATDNLSRELAGLGVEVVVLTSAFRGLPRCERRDGFTIHHVPVVRRHLDRSTPPEMATFILSATACALPMARRWRPDATIAFFGIPSGLVAYALKVVFGIPYVISLRGGDVPGFQPYDLGSYHRVMGPVIRFLWKKAACVVANSVGLQRLAQRSARDMAVEIIPNGVDVKRFLPVGPFPDEGAVRILFVGRLTYQKGIDILIRALQGLDRRIRFDVTLVGDGGARSQLQSLVERLGLEDRVHFVGWRSRQEIPKQYQTADIFVLPSRDEGMPNALLEAMACGLPVVATRISGNEELVQDGTTGLLVPREDPAALTLTLARLASNRDLQREMGSAGRAHVEKHYTWGKVAESYLRLMEPIVGENGPYSASATTPGRCLPSRVRSASIDATNDCSLQDSGSP